MKKQCFLHLRDDDAVFILEEKNTSKIEWEDAAEFSFEGHMYDLIGRVIIKGQSFLKAVRDCDEDALIAKYLKALENKSDQRRAPLPIFSTFVLCLPNAMPFTPGFFLIESQVHSDPKTPVLPSGRHNDIYNPPDFFAHSV